jgi:hypothetical protein
MRTDTSAKALRTYFSTEWRHLSDSWPITIIAVGVIMSFAWAVVVIWLVLGLVDLAAWGPG